VKPDHEEATGRERKGAQDIPQGCVCVRPVCGAVKSRGSKLSLFLTQGLLLFPQGLNGRLP